ncbi:hypothetical protein [Rosenbergiella metrosideri]|uniref:hypothetical protein n=1 Tax=Rosenbergiella metrosideri TaxID=2921185 RepID=UPI001F502457|nr:hypothetical protein [Rosenbergiella metrosideri]
MYADIADQADTEAEQHVNAALARRVRPEPVSVISRNRYCGDQSVTGTSYCCWECREDAEKIACAKVFNHH